MAKGKKFGRKDKKVIVFNEDSRRDYLLGFRERKNERRRIAHEELQNKQRKKMIEIRAEKKRNFLEQLRKQREELEALESGSDNEQGAEAGDRPVINATYEHPEHVVTVTTINDVDLDGGLMTMGANKGLPDQSLLKTDVNTTENKHMESQVKEPKFKKALNTKLHHGGKLKQNTKHKSSKNYGSSKSHGRRSRKGIKNSQQHKRT